MRHRSAHPSAMPDRLLSLILIAGCWVPPAAAGWAAARRADKQTGSSAIASSPFAPLAVFVLAWAAVWFAVNLFAMPPYIPGAASENPLYRPAGAVVWLAVVAGALVLPVSAIASMLAYRAYWRLAPRE